MKIIFSRKGFDSGYGGLPNLILPDGRLLFFPIPDKLSKIKYRDIKTPLECYSNLFEVLEDLNVKKIKEYYNAHLDPDLYFGSIPREHLWRPLFGQEGIALRHLQKQDVGKGDLFLFFGRFQKTIWDKKKIVYDKSEKDIHILFGYFCIGEIVDLGKPIPSEYSWVKYHPHIHSMKTPNNIFIASKTFKINNTRFDGAKVFDNYSEKLRLSIYNNTKRVWKLPKWFYPFDHGRPPLTYHLKQARWRLNEDYTELQSADKGQEFVLDVDFYPEWEKWALQLLS
ncbi:MAG TPA: hypothetical protein PLE74_12350 [Candidatus Cloacimonadota bacterium]|nr:hypothetical protein [Candidatus Cloacimonadota bacterium]